MEAEHSSLSCIIIDAAGDPIAQVAYRCALCRKICDSTTDAMLHYQVEHVDLFSYNLQQQQQQQQHQMQQQQRQQATVVTNSNARNNNPNSMNNIQQLGLSRQYQPVTGANSLLKRATPNTQQPGSLLKRSNAGGTNSASTSSTASASLLKRASNVIRNYQANTVRGSRRTNTGSNSSTTSASATTASRIDTTIHRPYTTTSASRAAKRYASGGSANTSSDIHSSSSKSGSLASELSEGQRRTQQSGSRSTNQGPATRRTGSGTPRHIQRTNQYTANLKAKISAQKSAAPFGNARQSTGSQSISGSSQRSSAASSSLLLPSEKSDADDGANPFTPSQITSGDLTASTSTTVVSDPSISGTQQTTTASPSTSQESTPGTDGKDPSKTYSLRPRSLGRRGVIIS